MTTIDRLYFSMYLAVTVLIMVMKKETPIHFEFLDVCMTWLSHLTSAEKSKSQLLCAIGWQQNIACLKMLWMDLHKNYEVNLPLTNYEDVKNDIVTVTKEMNTSDLLKESLDGHCFLCRS